MRTPSPQASPYPTQIGHSLQIFTVAQRLDQFCLRSITFASAAFIQMPPAGLGLNFALVIEDPFGPPRYLKTGEVKGGLHQNFERDSAFRDIPPPASREMYTHPKGFA